MTLSAVSPSARRKLMTACISWGITLQALLLPRMMVGAIVVVTKGNSVRSRKQ